jgi:hypothetical protein
MAHHAAAALGHRAHGPAGGDGEDGDVLRGFDLLQNLVQGELGEGIAPGSDENDVLAALDAVEPVDPLIERVEDVGLAEAGESSAS